MAGDHEPYDDPTLKGISRYFNSRTIRGRANVTIATLSGMLVYVVYRKLTKKRPQTPE